MAIWPYIKLYPPILQNTSHVSYEKSNWKTKGVIHIQLKPKNQHWNRKQNCKVFSENRQELSEFSSVAEYKIDNQDETEFLDTSNK